MHEVGQVGRRINRRDFLRLGGAGLAGAVLLGTAACGRGGGAQGGGGGSNGKNFTIKLSHVVAEDTPKGLASKKFKEVAEKESGGRIKVEIYPNSQLYGDEDELQALQSGSVQMLAPSSAKFTTIAPALQVLDLPFIFDKPEEIPQVVSKDSAIGQAIYNNKNLGQKNIKVMGLWDNGFMQLTANNPVVQPSDLQGVKVRIQPSDVIKSQFQAWGAEPTPMAFSEVYNALQQGVIDGEENTFSNIYSQKFHTVQSNMTESNHHYLGYVLVINKPFYDKLPGDLQKVVDSAAQQATKRNREVAQKENQKAKDEILKTNINFTKLNQQQRQAFKAVVVPKVWDEYANVVGQDIIKELKSRQNIA